VCHINVETLGAGVGDDRTISMDAGWASDVGVGDDGVGPFSWTRVGMRQLINFNTKMGDQYVKVLMAYQEKSLTSCH